MASATKGRFEKGTEVAFKSQRTGKDLGGMVVGGPSSTGRYRVLVTSQNDGDEVRAPYEVNIKADRLERTR